MDNSWKAYFIFSKKEQRGVMVLGCLLLGSLAIGYFFPTKERVDKNTISIKEKMFFFDPNTIDSMEALRLGIPQKQVNTLLRYRNKGGRFYAKEDMMKLYGLKKELVEKLMPFVVIQNKERNKDYLKTVTSVYKNIDDWSIDINQADEKQWATYTNLHASVIKNIINYRNHLGGFSKLNQIKKVYGFNEADYYVLKPHLKLSKVKIFKPNALTMSFEQWKEVGIFEDREIVKILRIRKENGGHIGWKELVILFDLTVAQAAMLQNTIQINE
jgi:DNA uptake protein ComE-like DNA-binding protein